MSLVAASILAIFVAGAEQYVPMMRRARKTNLVLTDHLTPVEFRCLLLYITKRMDDVLTNKSDPGSWILSESGLFHNGRDGPRVNITRIGIHSYFRMVLRWSIRNQFLLPRLVIFVLWT